MAPIKLLLISVFFLFTTPASGLSALTHEWSKRFGDGNWQFGLDVATDPAGDVVIAGAFFGTLKFGYNSLISAGGRDIYVAKFRENGNSIWSKRFGDASDWQRAESVAVDGLGNVIIVGGFLGTVDFGGGPLTSAGLQDIFMAKFDSGGHHLWSERFGDVGDFQLAQSVAVDDSNNILVVGHFEGTVDLGGGQLTSAGSRDIFVAKFAPDGNHLWSKRFGDADTQEANDVAVDGMGGVVITGSLIGVVDFGGDPLQSNGSWEDVYLVKLDSGGDHDWSKSFSFPEEQTPTGVAVDNQENIFVTGECYHGIDLGGGPMYSVGYKDIFLGRFDSGGNHVWSKSFGNSSNYERARGITVDPSGNVFIAGEIYMTVDFGGGPLTSTGYTDVFIAEFDIDGNHLWSDRFGDSADLQQARSLATDSSGNIFVIGDFLGTLNFGGGLLENNDGVPALLDIFLVEFNGIPTGISGNPSVLDVSIDIFPNPFNPVTTIRFTTPVSGPATIGVYDATGRLVTTLLDKTKTAGQHTLTWNARDKHGFPVATGIYFVRLESGGHVATKKIVLLK